MKTNGVVVWDVVLFLATVLPCLSDPQLAPCQQTGPCSCRAVDGHEINLKPLDVGQGHPPRKDLTAVGEDNATYEYNPCSGFTDPEDQSNTCFGVAVCQVTDNSGTKAYSALGDASPQQFLKDDQGIFIQYTFQEPGAPSTITSKVYIYCGNQEASFRAKGPRTDEAYTFEMYLTTKYGCLTSPFEISIGSILLIMTACALVIYLVGGIIYNKLRYKATGSDLFPNAAFWKDAPSLVKDGAVFIVGKARGKKAAYSDI